MRAALWSLAAGLVAMAAIAAGCVGSEDRVYFDDTGEGGLADASDDKPAPSGGDGGALPTSPATLGGTVTGLAGSGLFLQNNGGDDIPIVANGAFVFPTTIAPGGGYAVTIRTQPVSPAQTCTVTNGSGTAKGVAITDVRVDCATNAYPVGGTVVGLTGTGLVLQNNNANDLTINTNGPFAFNPGVVSGGPYAVSIKTQPTGQPPTCSVSGGTGTVVEGPVSSVVVNCGANTFTVGGNVTGLVGTLVITDNGTDQRSLTANGSYAFSTPIASGGPYAVAVKTQPAYPPSSQSCTVVNASGTIGSSNVTNVDIACTTNKFTVGGNVSGLNGTVVLQNNGGGNLSVGANGGFTFATPIASGGAYAVTVLTQPAGQKCNVTGGAGNVGGANVTSVAVTCTDAIALSENFDGVAAPALPNGWTQQVLTGLGGDKGWANATTSVDTPPNAPYVQDASHPTDIVLVSPAFTVGSATAQLTFHHLVDLETGYDGGVLEIAIAGGAFTDILAAGGSFVSGGYNFTISTIFQSTIPGRQAWSGPNTAFQTTTVKLPAAANGKSVQLRWRLGTDKQNVGQYDGWRIDSVVVAN